MRIYWKKIFRVKIFLGPNQSKIPVTLASSLQLLGDRVEYIMLETAGSNALDFHIAYYIGLLSVSEPTAFFHVISKDTGFDPLLNHLQGKKIRAQRSTAIAEIPYFKQADLMVADAQIETAISDLARRKASKPRTQKILLNTLHALFKREFSEQQLTFLFDQLCKRGIIRVEGSRLLYSFHYLIES